MPAPKITTGIRNRNYLNIKNNPKNPWQGFVGTDDRGHTIFRAPEWGLRAAIILLRNYWFAYSLRTAYEIVSRWAPASDTIGSRAGAKQNDPRAYADFIAKRLRVGANDNLQLFNPDKTLNNLSNLRGLISAMAEYENYAGFEVPDDELTKAFLLVDPDLSPGAAGGGSLDAGKPTAPPASELEKTVASRIRERLSQMSATELLERLQIDLPQTSEEPADETASDTEDKQEQPNTPPTPPARPPVAPGTISLDDTLMRAVLRMNAFPMPPAGEDKVILFGIRGSLPAEDGGAKPGATKLIRKAMLDWQNPRCTLGQWFVESKTIAVFPAALCLERGMWPRAWERAAAGATSCSPATTNSRKDLMA